MTRRVILSPWPVLTIKGEFKGDNLLSEKRINFEISTFILKSLSFEELYRKRSS
jgi:hypothetical protein